MTIEFTFAKSDEMDRRRNQANEFYHAILYPEEIPWIVTDGAAVYDFFCGDDNEIINKIKEFYGVTVTKQHFLMPFWQLLDFLEENRKLK